MQKEFKMENKISIILPVYNGAKYIENSINSVLNQTYKNIELIIVNDCSTDETLVKIRPYVLKDNRIKIVENKANQKLPKSLNIGFALATGKYLTWTSDDNLFHPSALEKMANVLDIHSNIDLVYADFSIVDMNGKLITEVKEGDPQDIRFYDNIGACFLYRTSLAAKVGDYDSSMFLAEDYDFFIRCYQNGEFYHLSEDLYDYGRHDANLSATRQNDISYQAYKVMNKHFEFLLSECHTQEDRNRFFYALLTLLDDSHKKRMARNRFYALDAFFAKTDRKVRFKNFIFKLLFSPFHFAYKIKTYIKMFNN